MKNAKVVKEIPLAGTEKGQITVAVLNEPYGEGSDPVLSVGVWLNSQTEEPDWKIHVPKENIDALIEAIEEAKNHL